MSMEARIPLIVALSVLVTTAALPGLCAAQGNYQVTTRNFVVHAPEARLAKEIGRLAEIYRKDLSLEWLGYEIPAWQDRCPIEVEIGMNAGGETSFAFVDNGAEKGVPISWQMHIFGPPDRLLDAVLPHEITHTIFATHFGRPLPRWADEGACTTVEHQSEREKNHRMLIDFLTSKPSRGIPFNRMFVMREYPQDILPLYAQGYSLAKFLINQKGRRHFIEYVSAGLENEQPGHEIEGWNQATKEQYGFDSLSELQVQWLTWVRNGSKDPESPATFALARAETDLSPVQEKQLQSADDSSVDESWYARQSYDNAPDRVATRRQALPPPQPSSPIINSPSGLRSKSIWR
jgi:hypothetical protein